MIHEVNDEIERDDSDQSNVVVILPAPCALIILEQRSDGRQHHSHRQGHALGIYGAVLQAQQKGMDDIADDTGHTGDPGQNRLAG